MGEDTHVEADQGLNYCIKELRRALGDDARNPTFIETLTRRGYRFLPPVELCAPEEPDRPDRAATAFGAAGAEPRRGPAPAPAPALVVASSPSAEPSPGLVGRPRRTPPRVVLAALTVVAVLAVAWLAVRSHSQTLAADPVETLGPAADSGPQRIAVLPFESADEVDEAQDVARQLASQLVSDLVGSTGPGFEVIASTTSFAYRDAGKTIGQIGRELGASYVIEGVYLRTAGPELVGAGLAGGGGHALSGPTARLCVRLVDTREEVVIWTRTYTVTGDQIDALPEVVSQEMAARLLPPV